MGNSIHKKSELPMSFGAMGSTCMLNTCNCPNFVFVHATSTYDVSKPIANSRLGFDSNCTMQCILCIEALF